MKTLSNPMRSLAIAVIYGFALARAEAAPTTLLNDPFTDGTVQGGSDPLGGTWYGYATASAARVPSITTSATKLPVTGNVLEFYGSSSSTAVVSSFASTTLANPGDWIQVKADFRTLTLPVNGYGPEIGLFNGTPLTADSIANAVPFLGWSGYTLNKYTAASSDVYLRSETPQSKPFLTVDTGNTTLSNTSSGMALNTTDAFTLQLTLTYVSATELLADYLLTNNTASTSYSGSYDITGSNLTFSFNEVALMGASNNSGAGKVDLDNVQVISSLSVPEPSSLILLGAGAVFAGMIQSYRRRVLKRLETV